MIESTLFIQAAQTKPHTDLKLELAEATPFIGGVVGWVDFASPQAPLDIERLAKNRRLKGLRPMLQDLPDPNWILREDVQPAIRATAAYGLRFDALIKPPQLPAIRRLLDRYPELPVVIDQGAKPRIIAGEIDEWAGHIRAIARDSDAVCKLSGIATEAAPGWTVETMRPYVEVLLESFGSSRMMFASDWPVLTENGDYLGWLAATEALTAHLSDADRAQIYGGTAQRFYGLEG
jgi:L-fuconolactonase